MKKHLFVLAIILILSQFYYRMFVCEECRTTHDHTVNPGVLFAATPQHVAGQFVFPVAPPHARGYYNAQNFRERNKKFGGNRHLGEDWNSVKGGNNDLGDPVYAVAHGYVTFAGDGGPGWGTVIRIIHKMPDGSRYRFIESLYGHVIDPEVKEGSLVKKGEQIAKIGNVHGLYSAHLHFEMRSDTTLPIGGGYAESTNGFLHPTRFIKKHFK